MFVYIREGLAKIRTANSNLNEKEKIVIGLLWLVLVGVSIVFDIFVPFNFIFNTIRMIFSIIIGVVLFAYSYIIALHLSSKKHSEDKNYKTIRERYSYIERRNVSIVLIGIWFVAVLIVSKPGPQFTTMSGVMITLMLTILSFWRGSRDEALQSSMGLRDKRDVDFNKRVDLEARRREEEARRMGKDD